MRKEYLRIDNGIKLTEGREQLYSVFLQVYEGECCGIIPGNMNEINGLLDILLGKQCFDYGHIYYKGNPVNIQDDFTESGSKIGVVDNQSHLVENLSIAENIFVVRKDTGRFFVEHNQVEKQLKLLLENFGIEIPVEAGVRHLNNLERCQLELLKGYVMGLECMIIDHRLQYLPDNESGKIYRLIEMLKERDMTFIIIDYTVEQVVKYADTIMLLNRGKTVQLLEYPPFDSGMIYRMLLSSKADAGIDTRDKDDLVNEEIVYQLEGIYARYLEDVSLNVKKGEIATIICGERKSAESLCDLLKGDLKPDAGRIMIQHRRFKAAGYKYAAKQGICFIENPSDGNQLFYNMNVFDNICIAKGSRVKSLWWKNRYRKNVVQSITELFGEDISDKKLTELDMTTQQKIVYYRWMFFRPDIVVCINPFSTVDIHLSRIAESVIKEYAAEGIGVLVLAQSYWTARNIGDASYVLENKKLQRIV